MTEWQNQRRARQLIEFDDLTYGRAAPTDIDAIYEGHNGFWVVFEVKGEGVPLPTGQRLCLERAVNDFEKAGKNAVAIVAEHRVYNPDNPIKLAQCTVRAAYRDGTWHQMDNTIKVKSVLDTLERKWNHGRRAADYI